MTAAQINRYGDPSVIEINQHTDKPLPADKQVLVQVKAAAINPFDLIVLSGGMQKMIPLTFPITLGGDFAGILAGSGEAVFGTAHRVSGGSGAMADFATVKPGTFAPKPKNITFNEAASLPLVGSSAVQALEEQILLKPGQKILIHGGAGGIGSVAIQLAKYLGAYVIATTGTKDVEFVRALGTDKVIDFHIEKFETLVKDLDAVFDVVGGETTDKSFLVLKKGGILVSMKGDPSSELAKQYGVTAVGQFTKNNQAHLTRVAALVEQGVIKPQIDRTFSLAETQAAFIHQQTGHPRGKVVIVVS